MLLIRWSWWQDKAGCILPVPNNESRCDTSPSVDVPTTVSHFVIIRKAAPKFNHHWSAQPVGCYANVMNKIITNALETLLPDGEHIMMCYVRHDPLKLRTRDMVMQHVALTLVRRSTLSSFRSALKKSLHCANHEPLEFPLFRDCGQLFRSPSQPMNSQLTISE